MTNLAGGFYTNPLAVPVQEIRRHWGWFVALGIAMIILGIIALGMAGLVTLTSVLVFGWVLVVAGIVQAAHAFSTRTWRGVLLHLLASILYVIVGLLMVSRPGVSALSLTLLMAAFFMVGGLFRLFGALMIRFPNWGWVAFNGVVTLALGILIWTSWPWSGIWVIGTFVGIDLLLAGWSYLMLAITIRALHATPAAPAVPPAAPPAAAT